VAGRIIVECSFETPLTREEFRARCEKMELCFRVRFVKPLATYLASDGSRAILVLDAPDGETVRNALRSAGTPFERVWRSAEDEGLWSRSTNGSD
jgi:hypothetical protein